MTRSSANDLPDRIGPYRVESLLGVGGTSTVYRARHESLDRQVALKVFRVGQDLPENALARLQREARLVAKLDHECVVRCWDFGSDKDLFFLALEYVPGGSLKDAIDRHGPLDEARVRAVALDLARALRHAHEFGIVHRDVKPGNVLVGEDGRVKLTDFGLARTAEDLTVTQPGTTVGTPQYLSPEQARNPRQADARSDLYSLGATLYHALTGLPPHRGDTLAQVITHILFGRVDPPERVRSDVSPAFSRVVAKLMAKDRDKRYRDAAELTQDLRRLGDGAAIDAAKVGLSWEVALRPRRAPWLRIAVAAGIAVAAIAFGAWWTTREPRQLPQDVTESLRRLVTADDVRAGRIDLAAAMEQALADVGDPRQPAVLRDLDALCAEQAALCALRAAAAARRELARGGIDSALVTFDDEARRQSEHLLGRELHALPEPLRIVLDRKIQDERVATDELTFTVRRVVTSEVTADIERITRGVLDLLEDNAFAAALALLSDEDARIDERLERSFSKAVRSVLPEAGDAQPSAAFGRQLRDRVGAELAALRRRVDERIEERRAGALVALSELEPDPFESDVDVDAMTRRVTGVAEDVLGTTLTEFPDESGALAAAIAMRSRELAEQSGARIAAAREQLEADTQDALEAALKVGDYASANATLAGLSPPMRLPLLAELAAAVPELVRAEDAAVRALESEIDKPVRLAARSGIVWNATLKGVDRVRRELRLAQNDAVLKFEDLTRAELVTRGNAAPAAAAVALLYSGELDAAKKVLDGLPPGESPAVRAEWKRRVDEKSEASELARSEATQRLAEFDRAVAAGDAAEILRTAKVLLEDARLARIDAVRARRAELRTAVTKADRTARDAAFRESIEQAVAGAVTFRADGTIEVRYAFDDPGEIVDFTRPGPEWSIRDGALTCVGARDGVGDLFRNRPGLRRELPFDPARPLSIAFDLDVPLDGAEPGLVGIRVFSTCFAIRSFGTGRYQGQANAWDGSLDDFEDYLFEPRLGETKPRKRGAHPVRPFALERGARYAIKVEWRPDLDGQVQLRIDGDVVYETRVGTRPRQGFCEIRASCPFALDDVVFVGTWAGRR
ncbi:MAG: protein kinase [Planctomycetes bacterium]|nr:protein kinase [Planctomycetota bacterium]